MKSACTTLDSGVVAPLRTLVAVVPDGRALDGAVLDLVRDELNVKQVDFLSTSEDLVTLVARPNFRDLGPRFGKRTQQAADAIRSLDQAALSAYREGSAVQIEVEGETHTLEDGDLEVAQEASGELIVKGEGRFTVALDPTIDAELLAEGTARELVNRIQRLRKDVELDITDRIELAIGGPGTIQAVVKDYAAFIVGETLAVAVTAGDQDVGRDFAHVREVDIDGTAARIALRPVTP